MREVIKVFQGCGFGITRSRNFNLLRVKRTAPVFEEERESLRGGLTWRCAYGGAAVERVRPVPEALECFREDRKIVDAAGEDISQTQKDLVTISQINSR